MSDEKEPAITAEDAMLAMEMAVHGIDTGNGVIGRMEKDEAQKLAQILFCDGEEMPDDIKQFFDLPLDGDA